MNDPEPDWAAKQRHAMLPFDHPYSGARSRPTGPVRAMRWILTLSMLLIAACVIVVIVASIVS